MPVGHIYLSLVDISTTSFLSHGLQFTIAYVHAWIYARDCKKSAVKKKKEEKKTHLVRTGNLIGGEKADPRAIARTLFHPRVIILLLVSVILQVIP